MLIGMFIVKGTSPPMTNAERQRRFRQSHPGYYQRLHAQRRAHIKALCAEQTVAAKCVAATLVSEPVVLKIPIPRERLMLPAPVEVLEFPGLKTLQTVAIFKR